MISIFSFLLVRKHDRNVPENFAMEEGIEIFEVNDGINRNDTWELLSFKSDMSKWSMDGERKSSVQDPGSWNALHKWCLCACDVNSLDSENNESFYVKWKFWLGKEIIIV